MVRTRLSDRRASRYGSQRRRDEPLRVTAALITVVVSLAVAATVLVSGWYTAAGAAAVAQMVAP